MRPCTDGHPRRHAVMHSFDVPPMSAATHHVFAAAPWLTPAANAIKRQLDRAAGRSATRSILSDRAGSTQDDQVVVIAECAARARRMMSGAASVPMAGINSLVGNRALHSFFMRIKLPRSVWTLPAA